LSSPLILQPSKKQALALQSEAYEILYGGARGGGKALPVYAPVLTRQGWRPMGEIGPGDLVVDPSTGLYTPVTGVFPQGVKPIFRVVFDDGAHLDATEDHLWLARQSLHPARNAELARHSAESQNLLQVSIPLGCRWDGWDIMSTGAIWHLIHSAGKKVWIPLSEPMRLSAPGEVPFSSEWDSELLMASLEERAAALRHIFAQYGDTGDDGRIVFMLPGEDAASHVVQLVRTLGGKAKQRGNNARAWFPRPQWLTGNKSGDGAVGFARRVVSIEYVGDQEAVCISVQSPRGVFVAGDYVVTHNTWAGMAWLLKHISKPYYRAMVIRRNAVDLREWLDRAADMYTQMGAKFVGKPATIRWPSGAIFYTGHLADAQAWETVQGWEVQRLLLEEAGQIPDEERYLKLIGSLRSKFPDIPPQVFLTANPGGPGHGWLKRRFVTARDYTGRAAEPYKEFDPDGKGTRRRIYIPALVEDNPVLMNKDPGYIDYLESLPPALKRGWRYGDWDAFEGTFFSEFRATRIPGEPPEALHVTHECPLQPHDKRWIATDWGYSHPSATYWFGRGEDSRVYVYRELVTRSVGPEELGVKIAEETLHDLGGHNQQMVLVLSPDAFAKRDDRNTIAEQITAGIGLVIGPEAVLLMEPTEEERERLGSKAWDAVQARREEQRDKLRIVVQRANNDRVGGWNYIRQLLRWWPVRKGDGPRIDYSLVRDLLGRPNGPEEYIRYISSLAIQEEVLPRLMIHSGCVRLIDGIQRAQYDDANKEDVRKEDGDDEIDALRYGLMYHRKEDMVLPRDVLARRALDAEAQKYGYLAPHTRHMMTKAALAQAAAHEPPAAINPNRGVLRRAQV